MSSSGLIYALIVGAWAVYLVPIWLRREDELNAARETERFTTAIRVLGHRDVVARRAVGDDVLPGEHLGTDAATSGVGAAAPTGALAADAQGADRARRAAGRAARGEAGAAQAHPRGRDTGEGDIAADVRGRDMSAAEQRARHSHGRLVARRRRVVATLLAASLVGVVATAALGPAFLWLTGVPGVLFGAYAVHLRHDERRREAERDARRRRLVAERRRARAAESAVQAEAERVTTASGPSRPTEEPVPAFAEPQTVRGTRRPLRPVAHDPYVDRPRAVGE